MSELFDRFNDLRKKLKPYDTNKDLLRASPFVQKEYFAFRAFLNLDKRLAPKRVREEFEKYKDSALAFKSDALNYDLEATGLFDQYDKYSSSKKKVAVITNGMVKQGVDDLEHLSEYSKNIDIKYKVQSRRKIVEFKLGNPFDGLGFMDKLPATYYVNIKGTSYNKNGLDFIYDYHNSSEDFSANLIPIIIEQNLYIYER